jgi:phage gpG-like protein
MSRGGVQVKITGVEQVIAQLEHLARETSEMRGAYGEIAQVMQSEARSRVPVASGRLAGTLRPSATRKAARLSAGSGIRYAGVQEYGWRRRNIAPQPYLVPGADAAEDDAVRILDREVSREIRYSGFR